MKTITLIATTAVRSVVMPITVRNPLRIFFVFMMFFLLSA